MFLAVSLGTYQTVLIVYMSNFALPALVEAFDADVTSVQWTVSGYSIAMAGLLLAFGRLSDVIGKKSIFVSGFIVFGIGAALCSIANSLPLLISFRLLQACGAAMLVSNGTAIIADIFPQFERGRALGLTSMVVAAAALTAPILGGFLIEISGWRATFYVHVPLSIAGAVANFKMLPDLHARARQRFDALGAASLSTTMVSLTMIISQGHRLGWSSTQIVLLIGVCAASFASFLIMNSRVEHPVLYLSLLRTRMFFMSNACVFIYSFQFAGTGLLLPFFLQQVLGYSATGMGLLLMAQPALQIVISPVSGWLTERVEYRFLASAGLVLQVVALILLGFLGVEATRGGIVLTLALLGIGAAIFETPNTAAIMGSVTRDGLGTAAGFLATMRHLGISISAATLSTVFSARTAHYLAAPQSAGQTVATAAGFRDALWVIMGLSALGTALSWARGTEARCQGN
jgi:EmrB/QacA subfamily drug resistance transporter